MWREFDVSIANLKRVFFLLKKNITFYLLKIFYIVYSHSLFLLTHRFLLEFLYI